MSRNSDARQAIRLIDECLASMEFVNAAMFLFGLAATSTGERQELAKRLLKMRTDLEQVLIGRGILVRSEEVIRGLREAAKIQTSDKVLWRTEGLPIVCSDKKLITLAEKVLKEGAPAIFRKPDVSQYFDFSAVLPAWEFIPDYTLFVIGGGIAFSSPELDLFQSMCWFHDQAVRLSREFETLKPEIGTNGFNEDHYFEVHRLGHMMCVQTVINAFLVIEAYVNSLASSFVERADTSISDEQRLYLREKRRDKNGAIVRRNVSTEDKLHDWIKIISPRGDTFMKGVNPFQGFIALKELRDSVVHLSERKMQSYGRVNFGTAKDAAQTVISLVEHIGQYIASDPKLPAVTWWLEKPQKDGLFALPGCWTPPDLRQRQTGQ
jgi:hypothetical protein